MLSVRRHDEMHHERGGWFEARWHFSFGGYHDPHRMGVGPLRVFNDDRIIAGAEWPMHPHRDVESLTYVVEGTFDHLDSLGNDGTLTAGAVQVMSFSHAGDLHSERNGSSTDVLRFLQFWILPARVSRESTLQQRQYSTADRTDRWLQVMGPPGEEGLELRQDARVAVSRLSAGTVLPMSLAEGRSGYVYVIEGSADLGGQTLGPGDAMTVTGPRDVPVSAGSDTEVIVVDVPPVFRPVGVWAGRG